MADALTASTSGLSDRSLAVAMITLTRYLADNDPSLSAYLKASLDGDMRTAFVETRCGTRKKVGK